MLYFRESLCYGSLLDEKEGISLYFLNLQHYIFQLQRLINAAFQTTAFDFISSNSDFNARNCDTPPIKLALCEIVAIVTIVSLYLSIPTLYLSITTKFLLIATIYFFVTLYLLVVSTQLASATLFLVIAILYHPFAILYLPIVTLLLLQHVPLLDTNQHKPLTPFPHLTFWIVFLDAQTLIQPIAKQPMQLPVIHY